MKVAPLLLLVPAMASVALATSGGGPCLEFDVLVAGMDPDGRSLVCGGVVTCASDAPGLCQWNMVATIDGIGLVSARAAGNHHAGDCTALNHCVNAGTVFLDPGQSGTWECKVRSPTTAVDVRLQCDLIRLA